MRCQYCNCAESKVIDSRPTEEGNSIRRRRECMGCGRRFTTYEKIEMLPLMVVKRDGRRETFDAQKIKAGILHACEKLPVSMQQIDAMTTSIEQRAYASMEGEISSQRIGDMVMEELKATNDVAYVRFAAVYRLFTDIGTFMQELQKLLDEPSMGLAPILVEQIFDIIRALHKSGTTILLVEQNAQMALSVANRAYVLETGKISMSGDAQELLHNDAVRKAYLGA